MVFAVVIHLHLHSSCLLSFRELNGQENGVLLVLTQCGPYVKILLAFDAVTRSDFPNAQAVLLSAG